MTAVCLQVRLDSHRLPEKALIKIEDLTIIEHAMRALRGISADLYVLLTTEECLSRLSPFAEKWGFKVFSGSKDNVLERFILAVEHFGIKTVIRATGDNPLVSSKMANDVLEEHRERGADYTNWFDAPLGTGIEVVEASALERAYRETGNSYDLEHVTPWVYNNPERFKLNIHRVPGQYYFNCKVSVDTHGDLERMKKIYSDLYNKKPIEVEELIKYLKKDILLIPSTDEGNGTGHIKRMISLFKTMEGNIYLYINDYDQKRLELLLSDLKGDNIISNLDKLNSYGKIIVDTRAIEKDLFENYLKGLNVIAIDEGGPYRQKIPFLIDILPLPDYFSKPNIRSLAFLDLPEKTDSEKNGKILVTFGGEDPAGLTELFCRETLANQPRHIPKIDVVLGPLYKGEEPDSKFNIIRSPSTLKHILPHYAGVITSFGITAFEAASLEIPVLLINPSDYHEEMGASSGFTSSGIKKINRDILDPFLKNPQSVKPVEVEREHDNLAQFIENLDTVLPRCPVCQSPDLTVIMRFEKRSYCRCDTCQMLFMLNFSKDKILYDKEYFFNQYENQYGKTYLADFDHLSQLAQQRIDLILKKMPEESSILDVGCAYGPFLKKAAENKFNPFGTDISSEAVAYVNEELHYPAVRSEFKDFTIPGDWNLDSFDVISMWYVIEHFSDLSDTLKKVNSLLRPGGLFAFSTPSGSGISSRTNFADFLFHSPEDHYTIWEPDKSQKILDLFGFRIIKKRITGHHPERFPSFLSKSKTGRKLLNLYSHWASLGDTFELYAIKVREL